MTRLVVALLCLFAAQGARAAPFVYVLNRNPVNGTVAQYELSPQGTLRPLPSPLLALSGPPFSLYAASLYAAPDGRCLYVQSDGSILPLRVGAGGTLSAGQSVPIGSHSQTLVITQAGVYTLCESKDYRWSLWPFRKEPDGTLFPLSILDVGDTLPSDDSLRADPHGHNLYVADLHNHSILQLAIKPDGTPQTQSALLPAGDSAPYIAGRPYYTHHFMDKGLSFSVDGRFAYVPDDGYSVMQFRVAADGTLHALTPPAVPLLPRPYQFDFPKPVTLHPSGHFAYILNGSKTVLQYRVASDGTLHPLKPLDLAASNTGNVCFPPTDNLPT